MPEEVIAFSGQSFFIGKDGRVVYCVGLENRSTERYRGFESLSFR